MQRHRNNTPSETPKDHYKVTVAIPLLDSLIHQMTERFSAEGRHASSLLCLVPSILLCSATDEILSDNLQGMLYWERDLPFPRSLANELVRWHALWRRKESERQASGESSSIPENLLHTLGSCDIDAFPNIHSLLMVACTLPITSAEAECSFSLMRRLKTFVRSTMTEGRLSDLATIAENVYQLMKYVKLLYKSIHEGCLNFPCLKIDIVFFLVNMITSLTIVFC